MKINVEEVMRTAEVTGPPWVKPEPDDSEKETESNARSVQYQVLGNPDSLYIERSWGEETWPEPEGTRKWRD